MPFWLVRISMEVDFITHCHVVILLSKHHHHHQQDLASHMNRRHRAAQHAQRASVNLNTLIYFKNRPSVEVAYVLSVAQDKIVVIVPRFGIEGSLILGYFIVKLFCYICSFFYYLCGYFSLLMSYWL
jgi:hypothetical protein